MKADLTRLTFDKTKHYRAVQQQQGRVQLDSDWNEQLDITSHRIETETIDVVGTCGAPMHADGFRLVATASGLTAAETARPENKPLPAIGTGDLFITGGRYYAGGVLAENEKICLASAQPDLPSAADATKLGAPLTFPLKAPGTFLAYLDVWPRLRTATDDSHIREVALGGPDTATRLQNTWQVKFLAAPDGANCATAVAAWDKLLNPTPGTLAASVKNPAGKTGPCIVDPGSGYRRLENQLYRVEVHTGGDSLSKATFKWSRDNGSIASKWLGQTTLGTITVETTGRDKVLNLAAGNWIELTDDAHEELGLPGVLAQIATVNGTTLTLNAPTATMDFANFPKNPKVRRWDSSPANAGKWITPDGTSVSLNTTDTFELESGVVVEFGAGSFRTGDYWLIPARTALPNVEWPMDGSTPKQLPPRGVEHHYCKLAIVEFKGGVFKITDCRNIFPPLTELTELFYVSGDSQEATPNPTLPNTTPLVLPLPLKVGVANGEWPVAGARVRFTVTAGGGSVSAPGGIATTGADGIASCIWTINSTVANPEVLAELLDAADHRVGLPVIFHARLNTAKLVSYDPKNCEGMSNATPPVVTVQDALDFLCHEKSGVDCCVTVGKIGDRPGDYDTIAEALEDLLKKRKETAICLTLLPGDHVADIKDPIQPSDEKNPFYFKIDGCNHASRLVLKNALLFRKVTAVVIRDISILADEGELDFDTCEEIEISHCDIKGRTTAASALLQFKLPRNLELTGNQIAAVGDAKAAAPGFVLKGIGGLAKAYMMTDEEDFGKAAEAEAAALIKLPATERAKMAKELEATIKSSSKELSAAEKKSYAEMVRTLGTEKPTAKTLAARFKDVRGKVSAAETGVGTAIAFADFAPFATFANNRIAGIISFGGRPAASPLTLDEIKQIADMAKKGALEIDATAGKLQIRGNDLFQFAYGTALVAVLRALIKDKKGKLTIWGGAHFTDNTLVENPSFLIARHVSLASNRFTATSPALGLAIARSLTSVGNIGEDGDAFLRTVTLMPPVSAADQTFNLQPM